MATLASGAVPFLLLGINEEMMFRGLVQGVLDPFPLGSRCVLVGLVLGAQHTANLLFGHTLYDTGAQVLSATGSGFAYAAARARIGTIWPLALLHGPGNFSDTHATVPFTPACT
ncbi:CPBP family intramembrane glutamic endopeptidase [Kocuria aegyptia]|uniref:CPBP family intramembrane glutamic endopeptidase n=1 Tax=Kocuria aegyptia TaxID=330943 RepID=UPI0031DD8860